jgi:hypothetical protein
MNPTFTSVFLAGSAVAFVLIGANTFINPMRAMTPLGLGVNETNARNELFANYGGLQIGMGLFLMAGVLKPELVGPALLAQFLLVGGLFLGRLYAMLLDGVPSRIHQFLTWLEGSVSAVSGWLFWGADHLGQPIS